MKIGLVLDTTLDSDAGVQQYFKGLARYLLSKGHNVRFLVPPSKNRGEFRGKVISFGKSISLHGNANIVPTVIFVRKQKIKETLERENFDILHISAPFSPILGAKILTLARCPIVASYVVLARSELYRKFSSCLRLLLDSVYKRIDAFVAISTSAKKEAESVIPGNYKIIPIGVDLEKYSNKVLKLKKFKDIKQNILFLGRLEERKGCEYIIRAFAKAKKELKNIRLIIAGDGSLRKKLEELVKKLNLKNVVFEGYVNEEIKQKYYATADVCVFPSIYGESFGVVLIEAMASGKVTLAFSNEGYSFVLKNLPELLVENRNVEQLSRKLLKYLKDKNLREEYERKCLQEARKFSWESVGERIEKVYNSLNKHNF
ncbi:glycosyltransferase family 4 protein [Patescibacteria group bacterium]